MTDKERKALAYRTMGIKSRSIGSRFERLIDAACDYYRSRGLADIEKTPEPMKPIRSLGGGRFEAVYTREAQADYKGCLSGGKQYILKRKQPIRAVCYKNV